MKRETSSENSNQRIMCAWFPHWPTQRLLHDDPSIAGQMILVCRRLARKGSMVADCSPEAVGLGVKAGMPLTEAEALVASDIATRRRLAVFEHDPIADRLAAERLAQWCQRFSPTVALADESPNALWLNVTGAVHLFGGEESLLRRLAGEFQQAGWTVHLALADSYAGAWALARYRAKPELPLRVPPGDTGEMLAPVPLEALQLPEWTAASLQEVGIERVGQIEQLPRTALVSRFGEETIAQLDRLFGNRPDVLPAVKSASRWEMAFDFELPVTAQEILLHVVRCLFDQLARQFSHERLGAGRIIVHLACPPAKPLELEVRLFQPSDDPQRWLELTTLQLERVRLRAPVSRILVAADSVGRMTARQQSLFPDEDRLHDNERSVGALVEQLTSRLGHQAVSSVSLVPDAVPECSYRLTPAIARKTSARRSVPLTDSPFLARPLSIVACTRVRTVVGSNGAPAAFDWQGTRHRLVRTWGPERIESGWWRGRMSRRDYYRVETTAAVQVWLFQDLRSRQWFLQGWFD